MAQPASSQPTLLFIPDISGFTRFVTETEITHSQHIIEELLEALIDANEIGLEISEIEGDAILFYRQGKLPTAPELLAQVRRMFIAFHAHLKKYETHRICQCGACYTANTLKLKFIIHFGDVGNKHVKEYSKLFGKEVIVVHRLLKNEVPLQEYALFTNPVREACAIWKQATETAWSPPQEGEATYDVGTVDYCYLELEPLLQEVPEPVIEDYSLPGVTTKILEQSRVLDAPLELAFDLLSDLSVRHTWLSGLIGSDQLNGKIARHGSTHRCVINDNDNDPFFVSHGFKYRDDRITFSETSQNKGITTVWALEKIDEAHTRMTLYQFIKRNPVKEFVIRALLKKRLLRDTAGNLDRFNDLCQAKLKAGTGHTAQIVLQPVALAA